MKRLRVPMFWATTAVVAFGLAVAALSAWLLGLIVFGALPGTWTPGPAALGTKMTWLDPVKVALTVAAGIGGAVALVVAYRKQRMAERQELEAAYLAAAAQLGDASPTVRLAGVYAMANLADSWPDRQQQCVDVLCAYLRVPWNPESDANHPLATKTIEVETNGNKTAYAYPDSRGEIEVRKTILRVIADHLRKKVKTPSWADLRLDFTGATLPELDWRDVIVPRHAAFAGATFSAGARFDGATFSANAMFDGATFNANAMFAWAKFNANAMFHEAKFSADAKFDGATFSANAMFDGATFSANAMFHEAKFNANAMFAWAKFSADARFDGATFSANAMFAWAKFSADARFDGATFSANAMFAWAKFNADTRFDGATFSANARFDGATFSANARFDGATFSADAMFDRAKFNADTNFAGATFRTPASWEGATYKGSATLPWLQSE